MPIHAADWYEERPEVTSYYQGDVVMDVPVVFLPDNISQWFLLRPNLQGAKLLDDVLKGQICKWFEAFPEGAPTLTDKWKHGQNEEFVAAKARLMNVVITTQSCDLEHRGYYQVAPVYPETEQQSEAKRLSLRENEINYAFFLPAFSPGISANSYADLSHTTLIPKRYFRKDQIKSKLVARLSSNARSALQEQLANYFGRPFGFSQRDTIRVSATYACIGCFYKFAAITTFKFEAGGKFEICKRCGEARWLRIEDGSTSGKEREPVIGPVSQGGLPFSGPLK